MDIPWRRDFDAARDPYTARVVLGLGNVVTGGPFQPEDADLTSIAGYGGTGTWLYRSAADTWSAVTFGTGISFSGGVLSATAGPTYTDEQAQDATAAAFAAGTHTAITVSYNDAGNSFSLANTDRGSTAVTAHEAASDPHPQYLTTAEGAAAYQPLDADLTSLAAASSTNAIYYRSAANTWGPIIIGSGLTFASGTLDAPLFTSGAKGEVPASGGGSTNFLCADGTWIAPAGGNVSNVGTPADNQLAVWTAATTIEGDTKLTWDGATFRMGDATNNGGRFRTLASGNSQFLIDSFGIDTNITFGLSSKGSSNVNFYTGAFARLQVQILDSVTPNTYLNLSGGTNAANIATNPAGKPINIAGATDGSAAAAGCIGELYQATGGNVPLAANNWSALVGLTLPAGEWDVFGVVIGSPSGFGASAFSYVNVSSTPNSASVTGTVVSNLYASTFASGAGECYLPTPCVPVRIAAATTYYLNITSNLAASAVSGKIYARRVH